MDANFFVYIIVMICSGPTACYVCRCKMCVPDHLFVIQTDRLTSLYVVKIIQGFTLIRR